MSSFPELDRLRVKRPCPKRWDELQGTGAKRFCDACELHVHDLSSMTRPEAEELLRGREGRLCVHYRAAPEDRRVLTREDLTRPVRRRSSGLRRLAASFLGLLLGLLPGCRPASTSEADPTPDEPADDGGETDHEAELEAMRVLGDLGLLGYVGEAGDE